ncbi:hypothetical protein COBT_000486, partial [Conglomerata obtusa]
MILNPKFVIISTICTSSALVYWYFKDDIIKTVAQYKKSKKQTKKMEREQSDIDLAYDSCKIVPKINEMNDNEHEQKTEVYENSLMRPHEIFNITNENCLEGKNSKLPSKNNLGETVKNEHITDLPNNERIDFILTSLVGDSRRVKQTTDTNSNRFSSTENSMDGYQNVINFDSTNNYLRFDVENLRLHEEDIVTQQNDLQIMQEANIQLLKTTYNDILRESKYIQNNMVFEDIRKEESVEIDSKRIINTGQELSDNLHISESSNENVFNMEHISENYSYPDTNDKNEIPELFGADKDMSNIHDHVNTALNYQRGIKQNESLRLFNYKDGLASNDTGVANDTKNTTQPELINISNEESNNLVVNEMHHEPYINTNHNLNCARDHLKDNDQEFSWIDKVNYGDNKSPVCSCDEMTDTYKSKFEENIVNYHGKINESEENIRNRPDFVYSDIENNDEDYHEITNELKIDIRNEPLFGFCSTSENCKELKINDEACYEQNNMA